MPTRRRRDGRDRRISEVYGSAGPTDSPRLFYQSQQIPASEAFITELMPSFPAATQWADAKRTSAAPKFSRKGRQPDEVDGPLTAKQRGRVGVPGAAIRAGGPCVSSTSSESVLSQADFDRYDMPFEKRRSAIAVVAGIFSCCSKNKDGRLAPADGSFFSQSRQFTSAAPRRVGSLSTAALVERARAQQEALSEIQDTSDMWEWHLEQQHAIADQEHEICERTSNAGSEAQVAGSLAVAAPLLQCDGIRTQNTAPVMKLKHAPEEGVQKEQSWEDDDGAVQNWGGPIWEWGGHQGGDMVAEKILQMFEAALLRYRWEVNVFCRVYMQQIVRAGYSLINTLMEMEASTVFLRRVHASYALEARINAALFRCFENDSFDDSGLTHIFDPAARGAARLEEFVRMRGLDPAEALRMHTPSYEPAFHTFAAAKSEEVLALLPAAALAFRSAAQRDRFMDAFLRAAKAAWLLHRLATVTTPQTSIVRVGRGHPVDSVYVEAVAVPPIGSCPRCPVTAPPSVEFMIMPGFLAAQPGKVFRCRIYQHFMCKQMH